MEGLVLYGWYYLSIYMKGAMLWLILTAFDRGFKGESMNGIFKESLFWVVELVYEIGNMTSYIINHFKK